MLGQRDISSDCESNVSFHMLNHQRDMQRKQRWLCVTHRKKGFRLFSVADCASWLFLVHNKASMERCFSDSDLGNLEVTSALDGLRLTPPAVPEQFMWSSAHKMPA